ncbi:hypothetical protein CPB83DRAFT_908875 [Crepidotus variabilis]|uniref:Uncharacterized protein n=1 Tax=Crepidotus variabilis TaxID=179855 RepID=A0A9P6EBH3_9AGAR|nr:hypothetical protein CPB83DRAFT_908875 [Crepidotus variabilis]
MVKFTTSAFVSLLVAVSALAAPLYTSEEIESRSLKLTQEIDVREPGIALKLPRIHIPSGSRHPGRAPGTSRPSGRGRRPRNRNGNPNTARDLAAREPGIALKLPRLHIPSGSRHPRNRTPSPSRPTRGRGRRGTGRNPHAARDLDNLEEV